jgi:hypothetical protein
MLPELQQHPIVLRDLSDIDNPYDLVEHQRVRKMKIHQHGYRLLEHLLQREPHLLTP